MDAYYVRKAIEHLEKAQREVTSAQNHLAQAGDADEEHYRAQQVKTSLFSLTTLLCAYLRDGIAKDEKPCGRGKEKQTAMSEKTRKIAVPFTHVKVVRVAKHPDHGHLTLFRLLVDGELVTGFEVEDSYADRVEADLCREGPAPLFAIVVGGVVT